MFKKTLLFITLILPISCSSSPEIPEGSDLLEFDSIYWKEILIDRELLILENDDRQKMLEDLIMNILPGMTKEEVIEILGDSEYPTNYNSLRYPTGWGRSSYLPGIDPEWLLIKFNDDNDYESSHVFTS
jgi:hypothetical protein